jgi:hypothetical protein
MTVRHVALFVSFALIALHRWEFQRIFGRPFVDPGVVGARMTRWRIVCTPLGHGTSPASNGYLLTVSRPCGVVFERWVTPQDADADLRHLASLN